MKYYNYKKLLSTFSSLNYFLSLPGNDLLIENLLQGIDQALSVLNNGGADAILNESQERADKGLPERFQVEDLRVLLVRYRAKVEELFGDESQLMKGKSFHQINESSPLWSLFQLWTKALTLDSAVEALLENLNRIKPETKSQPGKGGRKPGKSFFDCITPGKDSAKLRTTFSNLIKEKKGKDVARIIRAGKEAGILVEVPSVRAVKDAFGDVGSDSNLASFLEYGRDWRGELEPVIKVLLEALK